MKRSILLIIFVSLFTLSFAVNPVVSVNNAQKAAKNFLVEQCHYKAADVILTLQHTETNDQGEPVLYRFKINDRGFIIVSATEFVAPVLAYSYENDFTFSAENEAFYDGYKKAVEDARTAMTPEKAGVAQAWSHYCSDNFVPSQTKEEWFECQPLLTTTWGQHKNFNTYCPYDGTATTNPTAAQRDNHALAGSTAAAMAAIMNYYRYPTVGSGGVSYEQSFYPRLFVNFNGIEYNYDAMTSTVDKYNGQIAQLIYHAGASVLTDYNLVESDANVSVIVNSFKQYWKMDNSANMVYKTSDIDDDVWAEEYLIPELDEMHPIFYNGYNNIAHDKCMAFIIDGYQIMTTAEGEIPFFHLIMPSAANVQKAFYRLTNFSYKYGSSYIKNLHPEATSIVKDAQSSVTNTAVSGSVCDGAGSVLYQPNSNRSWLIETPNATSYTFTFKKIKTEENNDVITIYNGPTVESGIKCQYSGDYLMPSCTDQTQQSTQQVTYEGQALPSPVTVTASSVLITFTSNDSIEDYGFVIDYIATVDDSEVSACDESQTLVGSHYIIVDKEQPIVEDFNETFNIVSEDEPYIANHTCSWSVKPQFCSGYSINFRKFDLKAGDYIELITISDEPEILERFDVNLWPSGIYGIDVNKMKVRFVTDNWSEGNGFELEYWAILSVEQESGLNNLSVYPNPATNFLNVSFDSQNVQTVDLKIVDLSGKVLYNNILNHNGGSEIYKVPVSDLASGIYFLHLNTPTGKNIQKFIVK